MNKVILMGRLTREPDIRYSQNANGSMAVARFTLAVDRRVKREETEQNADFISCVSFGKPAEFAEKYLHQGTKIAIVGRIQTGSYTNRDGVKVYTTDVVVESAEFAESKAASEHVFGRGLLLTDFVAAVLARAVAPEPNRLYDQWFPLRLPRYQ